MKHLLIVDDMDVMRGVLAAVAREVGFTVTQAANGQQALERCRAMRFDAILSDWNMPIMNGEEFARTLRATGATVPIIMVTAEADRARVQALIEIGISGYIVKPFKVGAVKTALEKLYSRA